MMVKFVDDMSLWGLIQEDDSSHRGRGGAD